MCIFSLLPKLFRLPPTRRQREPAPTVFGLFHDLADDFSGVIQRRLRGTLEFEKERIFFGPLFGSVLGVTSVCFEGVSGPHEIIVNELDTLDPYPTGEDFDARASGGFDIGELDYCDVGR